MYIYILLAIIKICFKLSKKKNNYKKKYFFYFLSLAEISFSRPFKNRRFSLIVRLYSSILFCIDVTSSCIHFTSSCIFCFNISNNSLSWEINDQMSLLFILFYSKFYSLYYLFKITCL